MLPHFARPNGGVAGAPVQVPPPPGFRAISDPLEWARLGDFDLKTPRGLTAAQKAGIRYEERVQRELLARFDNLYRPQQEIIFSDARGQGRTFLDGLLLTRKSVVAIEIKSQHMPESWHQLCKYARLLEKWSGLEGRRILRLEICRSLDAAMPYPEEFLVAGTLDEFFAGRDDRTLGVVQWRI